MRFSMSFPRTSRASLKNWGTERPSTTPTMHVLGDKPVGGFECPLTAVHPPSVARPLPARCRNQQILLICASKDRCICRLQTQNWGSALMAETVIPSRRKSASSQMQP